MNPGTARRVIHVVPPGGGGVDRCVRDIVRQRPDDVIVHVTGTQWVLERPPEPASPVSTQSRFTALAPDDLVRWAEGGGLGAPLVLHAHSTVPAVRQACARLAAATAAPLLLTLHDVWFADPALAADELAQRLTFARAASLRCVPSLFIGERALQVLGEAVPCVHVPLGADPFPHQPAVPVVLSPAAQQARGEAGFDIAVIGAIGAHKGLAELEALARLLPPPWRIVLLGYTGHQLRQGWISEGRIWVHGIFDPDQLPTLVQQYGPRLALFPPGMPESHCYALGDAWLSGLTVLAPDHGALGERVRRHGGGALYAPSMPAAPLVDRLIEQLRMAHRHPGAVPLLQPLPTLQDMMRTMNALYDQLPASGPERPANEGSVQALAQKHLDSQFLRREVTDLQREVETAWRERQALAQCLTERDAELAQVSRERDDSRATYTHLVQRLRRLLSWLPQPVQARLLQQARRLLS